MRIHRRHENRVVRHLPQGRHDQQPPPDGMAVRGRDPDFLPLQLGLCHARRVRRQRHPHADLVGRQRHALHAALPLPGLSRLEPQRGDGVGADQRQAAGARVGPGGRGAGEPSCPGEITLQQHDAQGIWVAKLDASAASASYEAWAALANKTVPGHCSGGGGGTGPVGVPVPPGTTFDYVVVGGGAGGIVVADRLSEAGHSVLLIEKGPPSTGRWGGTMKPDWLVGTNLTRFDVPGLCNQIWHDSAGLPATISTRWRVAFWAEGRRLMPPCGGR